MRGQALAAQQVSSQTVGISFFGEFFSTFFGRSTGISENYQITGLRQSRTFKKGRSALGGFRGPKKPILAEKKVKIASFWPEMIFFVISTPNPLWGT